MTPRLHALFAALLVASCAATPPAPTATPQATPSATFSTPPTPSPEPSPTATPAVELTIATLPNATLDPAAMTAICDPAPSQLNADAGESTISCYDGLVLGLRAMKAAGVGSVTRLHLARPACSTTPCTADQLNTATAIGWSTDHVSVELDKRTESVRVTRGYAAVPWPVVNSFPNPRVQRPAVPGAPSEITQRMPFPFCGDTKMSENRKAHQCLLDSVLSGRPAELIERVFSLEGDPITWIYRFSGRGALVRYQRERGSWFRQAGSVTLPAAPASAHVDFDPWDGTRKRLP